MTSTNSAATLADNVVAHIYDSPEFQDFSSRLADAIDNLITIVAEAAPRYNCAVTVGVVRLSGANTSFPGVACAGSDKALRRTADALLDNPDTATPLTLGVLSRLIETARRQALQKSSTL